MTDPKLNFKPDLSSEDETNIDLAPLFEGQSRKSSPRLQSLRTLVLNADYQPLSYKPLSTVSWEEVFFWLSKGWERMKEGKPPIIHVVEEHDVVVRTSTREYKVPSVVAHTQMQPLPETPKFTRSSLYLRDDFTCQYTGVQYPPSELTLDHVMPQSRGGKSSWTNLVACHRDVNFKKADRTPQEAGLRLLREPYVPSAWELREKGRNYPTPLAHVSWGDYVYWNVTLEED